MTETLSLTYTQKLSSSVTSTNTAAPSVTQAPTVPEAASDTPQLSLFS